MPERGPIMAHLIERGIPLAIRGERWQKAPEWNRIKEAWKGPAVHGREYTLAIQCSQVALGLLSKGNRDLHTQRSTEIPFIGGAAFCAERTTEHQELYMEGKEALFWESTEECAEQCFYLLGNEPKRKRMVEAAKLKVESLGLSNDRILEQILNELGKAQV